MVYALLARAPGSMEISLWGFSVWWSLQRQKGRFHYCWHTELIFSVRLLCLEKAWNERIPCGLPHIPLTVLNSCTASSYCMDHTQECGVSKHLRHFKQSKPSPPHYHQAGQSISKCKQSGILKDISSNYPGQYHSSLFLNCISTWRWLMLFEIRGEDRVEAKQTVILHGIGLYNYSVFALSL